MSKLFLVHADVHFQELEMVNGYEAYVDKDIHEFKIVFAEDSVEAQTKFENYFYDMGDKIYSINYYIGDVTVSEAIS